MRANSFLNFILCFLVLGCAIGTSCKKSKTRPTVDHPLTFAAIYEAFWNGMARNYLFWDVDTLKHEDYLKYKSLFSDLDIDNDLHVRKSVRYFRNLSAHLTDGHFNIQFLHPAVRDSLIYPILARKSRLPAFHNPYSYFDVVTEYLDSNYVIGVNNNISHQGVPIIALAGTIDSDVLYFRCNSFYVYQSVVSSSFNGIQPVIELFQQLLDSSKSWKGIVIDVRSNTGGDLADLNFLIGRLIDKPLQFGFTRYRVGVMSGNYTPLLKAFVQPFAKPGKVSEPVVVLADRVSASLSEHVVMAICSLPNGVFIGDTTWGATGVMTANEIYNSGSFQVDSFLSVNMSSCQFYYVENESYEGIGFPPDIYIPFDIGELRKGNDPVLERAIKFLE